MKTLLDEMTQFVTDQGKPLLAFIEQEEGAMVIRPRVAVLITGRRV